MVTTRAQQVMEESSCISIHLPSSLSAYNSCYYPKAKSQVNQGFSALALLALCGRSLWWETILCMAGC